MASCGSGWYRQTTGDAPLRMYSPILMALLISSGSVKCRFSARTRSLYSGASFVCNECELTLKEATQLLVKVVPGRWQRLSIARPSWQCEMEDGRRIGVVAAKPVELLVEANDSEASLSSRCHAGGYMRPRLENGESRLVEVRRGCKLCGSERHTLGTAAASGGRGEGPLGPRRADERSWIIGCMHAFMSPQQMASSCPSSPAHLPPVGAPRYPLLCSSPVSLAPVSFH